MGPWDLLLVPTWLSCHWQLQPQQLHPRSRGGSLVLGQAQGLQLHPGALTRSCDSQGGCQGSLTLEPAFAELLEPHRVTLLCTRPGAVPL